LSFRLMVMPTVVTLLALRADRRDAREARQAFLGAFITDPAERRRLFRMTVLMVLRWVYPGEVLRVGTRRLRRPRPTPVAVAPHDPSA
jgi:hypothetical protein